MIGVMTRIVLIAVAMVVTPTTVPMTGMIVFVITVMSIIIVMMVLRIVHSVVTVSRPLLSILRRRAAWSTIRIARHDSRLWCLALSQQCVYFALGAEV